MERTIHWRAPRAGPPLRVREQAQPDHGADAERVARHRHDAARPTTTCARPSSSSGSTTAALRRYGIRILKIGHAVPDGAAHRARVRARAARRSSSSRRSARSSRCSAKDVLYGRPDRPQVVGKLDEEDRPAAVPGRRARLRPHRARHRPAPRPPRRIDSVEARIQHLDELKRRPKTLTLARTAFFCSGCPHNRSTVVPGWAAWPPRASAVTAWRWGWTAASSGSPTWAREGAQWVGHRAVHRDAAPLPEHRRRDVLPLGRARAELRGGLRASTSPTRSSTTRAVAMTGGQNAAGALAIPALTPAPRGRGRQADHHHDRRSRPSTRASRSRATRRSGIATGCSRPSRCSRPSPGVTVLIHDQQCAAEKRRLRKRGKHGRSRSTRVFINERVCEGCGDCGKKSNCLSVQPIDTEFGRKTADPPVVLQQGLLVPARRLPVVPDHRARRPAAKKERRLTPLDVELPEPVLKVPGEGFALHMMGIGGTGVVTVNQILGTAAMLDGRHVRGPRPDRAQPEGRAGGLRPQDRAPSRSNAPTRSRRAAPTSTWASTSWWPPIRSTWTRPNRAAPSRWSPRARSPPARWWWTPRVHFPELSSMLMSIDRVTRKDPNVYLDAQAIAEGLFDDHMAVNPIMLGRRLSRRARCRSRPRPSSAPSGSTASRWR